MCIITMALLTLCNLVAIVLLSRQAVFLLKDYRQQKKEGYVENPTEEIKSRQGWEHINAIKNNQVYYIDANSASRPTQNIIKALNEIAKAVYPDQYDK